MPAKTGSRNGLSYGWALGENNWNTGMDGNLTFIDRFGIHLSFKSFLNTPPGSPAAGDCHVIDTAPTGVWVGKAGQVAVYDDGAWRYGVPRTGWRAYCEADERPYVYDGGWAPTASEWTATKVTQAEAEEGTGTTDRKWDALRVRQATAAWWLTASSALGRTLASVADAAAGRTALGLGSASVLAAGQADQNVPTNLDVRAYYGVKYKPAVAPTLVIDFENSYFAIYNASTNSLFVADTWDAFATYLGADLTISRAGEQTYFDALGVMRVAAANTLQCDHDPLTGQRLGPYFGGARTNLCRYSADHTRWSVTEATLEADTWVAPDGSTARIWLASTEATPHSLTRTAVSTIVGTNAATFGCFVYIPVGADIQRLYIRGRSLAGGSNSGQSVVVGVTGSGETSAFSFISSAPFGPNAPAAVTASSMTVQPIGKGVFRISVSAPVSVDSSATISSMGISWTNGSSESLAGTANTKIGVWGWQYEIGGSPSPYIPVPADNAVTRPATSVIIGGSKFAGFYNQSEGTHVAVFSAEATTFTRGLVTADAANSTDSTGILLQSGTIRGLTNVAGTAWTSYSNVTLITRQFYKAAYGYKVGDSCLNVDGAANVLGTSIAATPACSVYRIGSIYNGAAQEGYIKRAAYLPRKITNTAYPELAK